MSTMVLVVDTSYLHELFEVPGYCQPQAVAGVKKKFEQAIELGSRIFVPLACLFELADNISEIKNGRKRVSLAKKLCETVTRCVDEDNPFRPWNITPKLSMEDLPRLCQTFVAEHVAKGIGFTDTAVCEEARRLKVKYASFGYKVHIWTKDRKLKSMEPDPEEAAFIG